MTTPSIDAWSYSRYNCYKTCPAQAKYRFIDKLDKDAPKPEALKRGLAIHEEAAKYLSGEKDGVPSSAATFKSLFQELRQFNPLVEYKVALTEQWKPTDFFASNVWLRAVFDVFLYYQDEVVDIIDHKTGKKYDDNMEQMELFAAVGFSCEPKVKHITTRLWYLDTGEEDIAEFDRADAAALQKKWEKKTSPMMQDTVFAPKPNPKCKWCYFAKSNHGPCEFG